MSMIFKVAYARGVQHALVQAGAIHKYANEAMADAAAAEAAAEMPAAVQPEADDRRSITLKVGCVTERDRQRRGNVSLSCWHAI